MQIQTNTLLSEMIHYLNKPVLILCDNDDTKLIAHSLNLNLDIHETNTGDWIVQHPNQEIVKVVRHSDINRITNIESYATVIRL